MVVSGFDCYRPNSQIIVTTFLTCCRFMPRSFWTEIAVRRILLQAQLRRIVRTD
jgi:hypothetical protein